MGKVSINIINPRVRLIANVGERKNSCISVFTIDIKVPQGTNMNISLDKQDNIHAYDSVAIANGPELAPGEEVNEFKSVGDSITVIVKIGNSEVKDSCNSVILTVTDKDRNITESRSLNRCVIAQRC